MPSSWPPPVKTRGSYRRTDSHQISIVLALESNGGSLAVSLARERLPKELREGRAEESACPDAIDTGYTCRKDGGTTATLGMC